MIDRKANCSPNFKWGEFIRPEDPDPGPVVILNLTRLAKRLEEVRVKLGKPLFITSGYRTPARNREIGGAQNSFHCLGMAADFMVQDIAPAKVQEILKDWPGGMGSYKTWTHLDIRPYKARWKG